MATSPREMLKLMKQGLPEQTGHSFEEWVRLASAEGHRGHKALTEWLKREHGLRHNQALWVAWGVTDPGRVDLYEQPADLVDALYSGPRANLRPIYDALLSAGKAVADDTQVEVCRTYTSLRNRAQFAIIIPRTQRQVDLELVMPAGALPSARLVPWKGGNARFSHRVRLSEASEVDDELHDWMRAAAANVRGR